MKYFTTKIRAIDPIDKTIKTYCGPNIPAISFQDAEKYCQLNGLGYCEVDGILVAEIPTKEDGVTADWGKMIDYSLPELN